MKKLTDIAQGIEKLYRGTSKQRENVGKIIEKVLVLQYPIGVEAITFDQLLEWELWPCFLKIFSKIQFYIMTKFNLEFSLLLQPVSQEEPRHLLVLLGTVQF